MSRKILVLTSSHLCRNPRVLKEATTLGAAGYEVTVMSISVQAHFERLDRELMRGLPFRRVVLDYAAPDLGARVTGLLQRGATWAARHACSRLGFESAQALGPAAALLRRARAFPADLTIVHTEIPLWVGQHLGAEGRRVAVDMEDWYSEDLLFGDRQSRPLRLLHRAEQFALTSAAYVSVPSACMAAGLVRVHGGRMPLVLHNCFPLQPDPRTARPAPAGAPRFVWFSQTIGPGRGLELFLAAWARTTRPSELHLLGEERAGYRAKLLGRLPAHRRADLHFIPPVPPGELPAKLAEFDIGLALEPRRPVNRDIAITNKILQYMNAGLAVVATDTAGQRELMAAAPGCGRLVTAHETGDFAAQLEDLLGDPAGLRSAQAAARAAAEQTFCWERETPRLLAAVESALR